MAKRKAKAEENRRPDFEQALGETFAEHVSPPVPFENATAQECGEVVCSALGDDVTPAQLARLSPSELAAIAQEFGEQFECKAPSARKIKAAIAQTLARWPVGSLGEET
jgi:hypothetical protein